VSDFEEELRRVTTEAVTEVTPLPAAEVMRRASRRHRRRLAGLGLAGGAVVAAVVAGLSGVAAGQHQVPPAVGPSRPAPSRPAPVTPSPTRPAPSPSPSHLGTRAPSPGTSGPAPSPSRTRMTTPPGTASASPARTPTATPSPW
jgi:hypothetical protein